MTDTQIPAGPWVITPDGKLPFDLRIHTVGGAAIAKVYGADAQPREELAKTIAQVPAMVATLRRVALCDSVECIVCKAEVADLLKRLDQLPAPKAPPPGMGFDEDHSVGPQREGRSIKRSHRAEGRNWVD